MKDRVINVGGWKPIVDVAPYGHGRAAFLDGKLGSPPTWLHSFQRYWWYMGYYDARLETFCGVREGFVWQAPENSERAA